MSEAQLQDAILELARFLGYRVYHVANVHKRLRSHSSVGFPDLVIASTRHMLVRECKRETGRLTREQEEWIRTLDASGVDVGVWRPSDYLDGTVESTLLQWSDRNA